MSITGNFIFAPNTVDYRRLSFTAIGKFIPEMNVKLVEKNNIPPLKERSPEEVIEWLCEEIYKLGWDYEKLHLSYFSDVDGKMLLNMTKSDFAKKDELNGKMLFQIVQFYKSTGNISQEESSFLMKRHTSSIQRENKSTSNTGSPPKGRYRKKKYPKVWEFIRDLLLTPEYCPSWIRWENYEKGTFRFVQNDKVAEYWGKIKCNPKMNFEFLKRAIRYNYKSEYLRHEARLIYGFGPKATGWQTDDPNFLKNTE